MKKEKRKKKKNEKRKKKKNEKKRKVCIIFLF